MVSRFKTPKIKDKKHLAFLRTLPCVITGKEFEIEAAHIRYQTDCGMGEKPSDCYALPLHHMEHKRQHRIGELEFWPDIEEAKKLAWLIYKYTGNRDKCLDLIQKYRMKHLSKIIIDNLF